MVTRLVEELYLPLSQARLEAYRPAGGTDLEMLTNYFWNIDLAEGLMPALHAVEVALRNTVHSSLTNQWGTDMWFLQPGLLGPGQVKEFTTAHARVARKPPVAADKLVPELNFGFWVTLLSAPYEQSLWRSDRYAPLRNAFPYAVSSRKEIHERFNRIRLLRNRVFHHEKIYHRATLLQEHAGIHEAIRWISPRLHEAIHAVDNFRWNFAGRGQVEAGLKRRVGIP